MNIHEILLKSYVCRPIKGWENVDLYWSDEVFFSATHAPDLAAVLFRFYFAEGPYVVHISYDILNEQGWETVINRNIKEIQDGNFGT